jgi:putative ABC transport system permease protein
MFKNYFLVALRNIKKQKVFSMINLLGMAVGMAGFTFFAHIGGVKLNSDRFHKNVNSIYTVVLVRVSESKEEVHTTYGPAPLAQAVSSEFPEFQETARVLPVPRMTLKHGNTSFYENNILFVDPSFLSIFSFAMAEGIPDTALAEPNSIVISETISKKYFGDDDPIGQTLILENKVSATVTGITKNIPRTSSIRFDFLVSMGTARAFSVDLDDWRTDQVTTFLLARSGFRKKEFDEKLPAFVEKYYSDSEESPQSMYVFPFSDFRLKASHITSFLASSHPAAVTIIFSIGILLLFIVCINFINLSTARSMYRTKEISLRKVVGAQRFQLIIQFLGESMLLAFLALPVAILIYELIHPAFSSYLGSLSVIGYTSGVSNSIFNYPFLLKYLLFAAALSGLFSGLYPAFFLSAFQPDRILKGNLRTGRKKKRGSKILIVLQFVFAVIFIAAASLIKHQFRHLIKADLGFNREQVAVVSLSTETKADLELLQTKFAKHSGIVQVTASERLPVVWENPRQVRIPDTPKEEAFNFQAYGVDYGFTEVLEMEVIKGRSFSHLRGDRESLILSETAVKKLRWEDPLGKQLMVGDQPGTVIGVVKDFLFADIGFSIPPAVLYLEKEQLHFILAKFSSPEGFPDLREFLEKQWLSVNPDLPFECQTLGDHFNVFFELLGRVAGFLNAIGIAAVVLASLGLFGLATYMVERRTKEIGIRKVLGAPSARIMWNLMSEYLVLVAVANAVSLGLIYFGWQRVLQTGILFMTDINAGTYVYALSVTLLTAVLAVASKTLKTVRANPVDALRSE